MIWFNSTNSTTFVPALNQTLDIFNLDAITNQGYDTICLDSQLPDNSTSQICLTDQLFSMVQNLTFAGKPFKPDFGNADGIFGIGREAAGSGTSFISRAVAAGLI